MEWRLREHNQLMIRDATGRWKKRWKAKEMGGKARSMHAHTHKHR